jgi:hypothetical protein
MCVRIESTSDGDSMMVPFNVYLARCDISSQMYGLRAVQVTSNDVPSDLCVTI